MTKKREKIMVDLKYIVDLDEGKKKKLQKIPLDTLEFIMELIKEAYDTGVDEGGGSYYTGDGDDW